jgi:mono/diheme cytochrome c family protein
MKRLSVAAVVVWLCSLGLFAQSQARPGVPAAGSGSAEAATQTVKQYCVGCHNDRGKAGDLSLAAFDVARSSEHPETSEKIIRKLRASMMPPAGARRPDEGTLQDLRRALEVRMDQWASANPNPGWRPFQRLTRAEYARAVSDLLDVDVDVTAYLPPDTMSQGFDNIADTQSFSPALPQGYLRAASQISRLAVGDRGAAPTTATHRVLATEIRCGTRARRSDRVAAQRSHVSGRRFTSSATLVTGERRAVQQHGLPWRARTSCSDLGRRRACGGARGQPGDERRRERSSRWKRRRSP